MTTQPQGFRAIRLADGVNVRTDIPEAQLPALRAGFAGYPMNPRWNALKFHAWKQGRHWKQALQTGELVVSSVEELLVTPEEAQRQAAPAVESALAETHESLFAKPVTWIARAFVFG